MDDRQIDIRLGSVQRMQKEWQANMLRAFLLGKKYGQTKPIAIDRLGDIMAEFQRLIEESQVWQC